MYFMLYIGVPIPDTLKNFLLQYKSYSIDFLPDWGSWLFLDVFGGTLPNEGQSIYEDIDLETAAFLINA